jgi:hypothetical protein
MRKLNEPNLRCPPTSGPWLKWLLTDNAEMIWPEPGNHVCGHYSYDAVELFTANLASSFTLIYHPSF